MKKNVKIEAFPFVMFLICQSIIVTYACLDDQDIDKWFCDYHLLNVKHYFIKILVIFGSLFSYAFSISSLVVSLRKANDA